MATLSEIILEATNSNYISPYVGNEIDEEIGEIENTPDEIYPTKIKELIINKLRNIDSLNITELDIGEEVENTDAFNPAINIEDIIKGYKHDKEYVERLRSITKADKFPAPVVVKYNGKKRLIGGNRRAVKLNIEAIKQGENSIPVILIDIDKEL